ncbi:MAG: RNA methyltransferase [Thermoanaerobaculum sp.]|nr:RNA methyltransferase [Thermoanaerobaculum sp.]
MPWTPLGRTNPRVGQLRAVVQGKEPGLAVVDGIKLIRDLWQRGIGPVALFAHEEATADLARDPQLQRGLNQVPGFLLSAQLLQSLAPTQHSQGILAIYAIPRWGPPKGPVVLYLDRLQDPANVGALVRVAAALGAGCVVCSPGCANPFSPKAIRASAGASLFFPVLTHYSLLELRRDLGPGFRLCAAATSGGTPLPQWRGPLPSVLVLGNEGQGLDPALEALVDERVTIPLCNRVESLNVSVAGGILLAWLLQACQGTYTG